MTDFEKVEGVFFIGGGGDEPVNMRQEVQTHHSQIVSPYKPTTP